MDNTTQQDNMQGLNPDQIASSLAFSTNLHEQMLPPEQPVESIQTPQDASQAPTEVPQEVKPKEDLKSEIQGMESRIMDEIASLWKEFKSGDNREEINSIRKELEKALNENGEQK